MYLHWLSKYGRFVSHRSSFIYYFVFVDNKSITGDDSDLSLFSS